MANNFGDESFYLDVTTNGASEEKIVKSNGAMHVIAIIWLSGVVSKFISNVFQFSPIDIFITNGDDDDNDDEKETTSMINSVTIQS